GDEHGHLTTGQIGYQCRQTIVLPLRPAVHDRHVLALDEARVLQAPMKSTQLVRPSDRRCPMEKSNDRHRRLLRARRERPASCGAAEQRDDLASSYAEHGLPSRNPLCQLTAGSGCPGCQPTTNARLLPCEGRAAAADAVGAA